MTSAGLRRARNVPFAVALFLTLATLPLSGMFTTLFVLAWVLRLRTVRIPIMSLACLVFFLVVCHCSSPGSAVIDLAQHNGTTKSHTRALHDP
jgi:hypothetical protein